MKRLSTQDWSLIARYLKKEETTPMDLVQFHALLETYPDLKEELARMEDRVKESPSDSGDFNAEQAFQKLHERLMRENLL
jgi:hypothetical protein